MTSDPRGEFTKKIDQELILRHTSSSEKQAARILLEQQESHKKLLERNQEHLAEVEQCFGEIVRVLASRSDFIKTRFPNAQEGPPSADRGVRYRFARSTEYPYDAMLEFRVKDNDVHQALFVESSLEVVGKVSPKSDYITFPVKGMRIERVKKFVERKILDFIKAYLE